MENILIKFDYEVIVQNDNTYVLCYKSKYYKIGNLIYEILYYSKMFNTIGEVSRNLSSRNLTSNQLYEIIQNNILPIFNKEEGLNNYSFIKNYWWSGQLLSAKTASKLSKPFNFLFGKFFTYIFILLLILNIGLYLLNTDFIHSTHLGDSLLQIIIMYFMLFIILLIHEFGHISASSVERLKPQELRFGLYYFMPVLFVNLSDAWRLNKKEKIKLNLGGITTQLLINIILMLCLAVINIDEIQSVIATLLIVNTIIVFVNLIPFFKFDGYWILSDITGIPNLMKESNLALVSFLRKKGTIERNILGEANLNKKYFLIGFGVLRVFFIASIIIIFIMSFILMVIKSTIFAFNIQYIQLNSSTILEIIKKLIILIIYCLIIRKYIVAFFTYSRKITRK